MSGIRIHRLYQAKKKIRKAWFLYWQLHTDATTPAFLREDAVEVMARLRADYLDVRRLIESEK